MGPRVASLVASSSIDVVGANAIGVVLCAFMRVGEHLMRRLNFLESRGDFGLTAWVTVWMVQQSC